MGMKIKDPALKEALARANKLRMEKKVDEAREAYKNVIEQFPESLEAFIAFCNFSFDCKDYGNIVMCLTRLEEARKEPNPPEWLEDECKRLNKHLKWVTQHQRTEERKTQTGTAETKPPGDLEL